MRVATAAEAATLGTAWTVCLTCVSGLRSWFFLPVLTAVIPQLVAMRGGDALTISFNTVAILCVISVAASSILVAGATTNIRQLLILVVPF